MADELTARWGLSVVLLFGPGQQAFAQAVRERVCQPEQCVIAVTPTMRQAAAVLARSVMYVGTDTGTRHVAIAMGVPTVGVFGRQHAERWTPPDAPEHLTVEHDPGCKNLCYHRACEHLECIRGITVSAVLNRVNALLQASGSLPSDLVARQTARLFEPTTAVRGPRQHSAETA